MEQATLVVHLPLRPNRRSGRKYLVAPDGSTVPATTISSQQKTMQDALVRAFRWRQKIEAGKYNGITDLARAECLRDTYVLRQLTLTCLAPSIVEAILNNTQPRYLTLQHLYDLTDLGWDEQAAAITSVVHTKFKWHV